MGLGSLGAGNLSFLHPQVIATKSPAAAGWASIGGAFLVVAQHVLGLASISTSIVRHFHKESLADQHAMGILLDLVPVVLHGLHSCKDGWERAALV